MQTSRRWREASFKSPKGLTVKEAASRHFLVQQLSVAKERRFLA
jgi:hypothetical protein